MMVEGRHLADVGAFLIAQLAMARISVVLSWRATEMT
jgi:hypothetical protein